MGNLLPSQQLSKENKRKNGVDAAENDKAEKARKQVKNEAVANDASETQQLSSAYGFGEPDQFKYNERRSSCLNQTQLTKTNWLLPKIKAEHAFNEQSSIRPTETGGLRDTIKSHQFPMGGISGGV